MNTLNAKDIKAILNKMSELMAANKDWLTKLDAEIGDGDLGLTMPKGFGKAAETIAALEETDIGIIFSKAGLTIAQTAPSTMGTLVASGFMKSGKAIKGKQELALADVVEVIAQFEEGIMARGKSQPGGKTILDALHPHADAPSTAPAVTTTHASSGHPRSVAGSDWRTWSDCAPWVRRWCWCGQPARTCVLSRLGAIVSGASRLRLEDCPLEGWGRCAPRAGW